MGKKFIDISMTLSPDIPVYPGDPALQITDILNIDRGDIVNLSAVSMGVHTGTHIDSPKHFYKDGMTIEEIPLEYLIGPVKVFEIENKAVIEVEDLKEFNIEKNDRILLKTINSSLLQYRDFATDFTYLSPEAARYLAQIGIRTLGFDYLSIDKYNSKDFGAHYALLGQNIVIIEGLNLQEIEPGEYYLIVMPLKLKGGNGSPARAALVIEN